MLQFSFSGIEMSDWEREQIYQSLEPVIERAHAGGKATFTVQPNGTHFETTLLIKVSDGTMDGSMTAYAVGSSPLASSLKAVHKVSDLVTSLGVISTRGGDHGYFSQNRAI
ncbi:MAG: hypothetical protein KF681_02460 [Bdellovibrionaceae bacterium]|nr:hypothetical protein [Pseudobdellovibrionaceae bacterium]